MPRGKGERTPLDLYEEIEQWKRTAEFWKTSYERCNDRVCELLAEKLSRDPGAISREAPTPRTEQT